MGGLPKKAQQIKDRSGNDVSPPILIDTGNLLFKQPTVVSSQELLTARGLMEIYQRMAYDAVAVGPNDLAAGMDFLTKGPGKDFPWISANLVDNQGNALFPAVKIIQRGGMKIGIIGLTGHLPTASQEISITDWRKVLPGHLKQLSTGCQLVIALSSLSDADNIALTQQFPEIHILITADRQRGSIAPSIDRNTLVTQTMSQGKYLGMLNLNWISGGTWEKNSGHPPQTSPETPPPQLQSTFTADLIPLDKGLPEDGEIKALVEGITQQISKHNQKSSTSGKPHNPAENKAFTDLTGFARCQECHPVQTDFWNRTRHAQAYATLQSKQQNFNLDCLPCHITVNTADKTDAWSMEALLAMPSTLQSVGCETCHDKGLAHADSPDKIKPRRKVEEKTCLTCHTKERDPAFNYRQKLQKVQCPER